MYKNKIDGLLFETEQEAFEYFKNNYLETNTSNDDSMLDKLKNVFPDADFKISTNLDWGDFKIDMTLPNAVYTDYIGKHHDCLGSVEDFITRYQTVNESVQYILDKVSEVFDFNEFRFVGFNDDYGNGWYINFEHEYGRDTYEGYNIEGFIESLSQYFINVVEGEVEEIRKDGYFEDYSVGGVPVKGLLKRAKKVRLEIVSK